MKVSESKSDLLTLRVFTSLHGRPSVCSITIFYLTTDDRLQRDIDCSSLTVEWDIPFNVKISRFVSREEINPVVDVEHEEREEKHKHAELLNGQDDLLRFLTAVFSACGATAALLIAALAFSGVVFWTRFAVSIGICGRGGGGGGSPVHTGFSLHGGLSQHFRGDAGNPDQERITICFAYG